MKKSDTCLSRKRSASSGCNAVKDIVTVQPFPTSGLLGENLSLPLPILKSQLAKAQSRAYSYIVRSVRLDHETTTFEQHGSAPNFQGGTLTLCTCKYQMRASQTAKDWQGVWLAGFTSRTIHDGRHWLFYLARIEFAYDSHADLWSNMRAASRNAKAAQTHFLGDMFKPKTPFPKGVARFSPTRYYTPPFHSHRQHSRDRGWHNDINYKHAQRYRHPPVLVADPKRTFLWEEPRIYFDDDHCRNFCKWSSWQELVSHVREARR